MKSYWQESIDKNKYISLDKDISTDVCVVGGGIVRNNNSIYAY